MKRWFIVSLVATLLGGCVVTPVGYRYNDGYYRDDYYHHGYYHDRDDYRGYGYHDRDHY